MPWRAPPEELTWAVEVFSTVFLHVFFVSTSIRFAMKIENHQKVGYETYWNLPLSHCVLSSFSFSPLKVAFPASSMAATGSSGSSRSFWRLASNARGLALGACTTSSPQGLKTCCCKASQPKTKTARKDPMLYFTQVPNFVGSRRAMNLATHRALPKTQTGALEDLQGFSGEPRHEALNVTGAWDKWTMTLLDYDDKVFSVL